MGRRKRKRRVKECDACGERARLLIPRTGRRACRSCLSLDVIKWVSACVELDRIRADDKEQSR